MINQKKASITTATVEIHTLTVNDKQVTLAAFRQFPQGDLVDEDGSTFNGIPWGWINYHWKAGSTRAGEGRHGLSAPPGRGMASVSAAGNVYPPGPPRAP